MEILEEELFDARKPRLRQTMIESNGVQVT